ncbi:hypothetical protein SAMN04488028_105202 [Reichenbachiella agariperforans]|uniref:Uncharacterized protein n=2 Tax=Reichenbachiellaceae TaxID=2762302 RepID=A0A1M6SY57_REIAG|nr:hypothetical protein [Reichenbachiella agariperforans]RJE75162.1 hypothetical protein BGP76_18830 [Reichenbachiella sp. MSK19-1]SHK49616.1 hypothetical protein SAMN04488028_105202 [Reichenbachiella agariperforans]
MKYLSIIWFVLIAQLSWAQQLHMTGVYKGESLYIKNPYVVATNSFCIQSIHVNGQESKANLKLTAISLHFDGVKEYAPVNIKINHADSCQPKIVNPEAILYYSSFKFDSLVMNDSILHWYTKGDRREGQFIIEQLKTDRWDEVMTVRAKGRFDGAAYVYFPEHNDGGNKYRIRYELPNGRYLYSEELEYYHYPDGVTFSPKVVTDYMYLSREARFEIMNANGEVILQGTAKKIPLKRLNPGDYTILLEGDLDTFVKK